MKIHVTKISPQKSMGERKHMFRAPLLPTMSPNTNSPNRLWELRLHLIPSAMVARGTGFMKMWPLFSSLAATLMDDVHSQTLPICVCHIYSRLIMALVRTNLSVITCRCLCTLFHWCFLWCCLAQICYQCILH